MRNFLIGAVAVLILIGAGLFFASQKDYVFRFTEPELRDKLNERVPWSKTYLFVFNVTIDNPRVDLIEGSDRVAGGLDVLLNIKLGDNDIMLNGAVDVSGGVEYRASDGEFYLADPQIEALRITGIPENWSDRTQDVVSMALAEYYKTRPIYSLEGTEASKVAARLLLKDVAVKDEKLVVTLSLKKKQGQEAQ